jgi:hypothetical protein
MTYNLKIITPTLYQMVKILSKINLEALPNDNQKDQ